MTYNVQDLITRVRERVHDRSGHAYADDEVLRAADDALRQMFTAIRTVGDGPNLDYVDFAVSSLTQVERNVYTLDIPDVMADPQHVELISTDNGRVQQIMQASLAEKGVAELDWPGRHIVWNWGPKGTFQLRGIVTSYVTLRIWYVRQFPPLFYFAATAGSTTSATIGAATGGYKARNDWYAGYQFEVVSGAAANVGQVRRASAFSGGVLTMAAWPAAIASTNVIAMVVPLPDEHHEYLAALVAMRLLRRSGAAEEMQLLGGELSELRADFESGIARRASGEPPRLSNSRRGR